MELSHSDLSTLQPDHWLNDQVSNSGSTSKIVVNRDSYRILGLGEETRHSEHISFQKKTFEN